MAGFLKAGVAAFVAAALVPAIANAEAIATSARYAPQIVVPFEVHEAHTLGVGRHVLYDHFIDKAEQPILARSLNKLPFPAWGSEPLPAEQLPSRGLSRYILPQSDKIILSPEDIAKLSIADLSLAHYEIFARHGLIFSDPELARYFAAHAWYFPRTGAILLSQIEAQNVRLILEQQRELTQTASR